LEQTTFTESIAPLRSSRCPRSHQNIQQTHGTARPRNNPQRIRKLQILIHNIIHNHLVQHVTIQNSQFAFSKLNSAFQSIKSIRSGLNIFRKKSGFPSTAFCKIKTTSFYFSPKSSAI
jgi:hypothetical protein